MYVISGMEPRSDRGGLWPPPNFKKILNSKYIFEILENKSMSFSKNKENKPMKNYICPSRFRILVPSLCDLNLSPPYYLPSKKYF